MRHERVGDRVGLVEQRIGFFAIDQEAVEIPCDLAYLEVDEADPYATIHVVRAKSLRQAPTRRGKRDN